ncbi:hypothetical protein AAG570_004645 [Ranatra chinensis]|uniref:Amino acid transporter transmembrane domain-containing protein n=1 Tax=Ranatra chinensis TaxID=642074 RepID=A0ABD0YJM3_9HEMI
MAGSGVLALPKAVVDCGWIGMVVLIVLALNAFYGATRLGICWQIVEERYPEHRGATRNPYPTIGYRAVGNWGRLLVSGCIQITLFGAGVAYLLLASQIVQDLMRSLFPSVTFCSWYVLFAVIITPPMWLGSPKDFWFVGIGALLTTAIACVLIFTQMVMEGLQATQEHAVVPHHPHTFIDFFIAFGIILFAFGGASTFPTIQNDMIDRAKFSKSAMIGFSVILCLYVPVALIGYIVYGDDVNANVVLSLSRGPLVSLANLLMALHLVMAFLIVINPVALELENIFDVPHEFCALRCILRSLMVLVMVIIGESIPEFAKILALVGGSTITLGTFVLPNYFYMRLCDQESPDDSWPKRSISLHMRIYMWELIVMGMLGGVASTYAAILAIFSSDTITHSCFWD